MKILVTKGAVQSTAPYDAEPCTHENHADKPPHVTITVSGGPWCVCEGEYQSVRPSPYEWNNDGHLLRVTINGDAGVRFAVICPSQDADLSAVPFGALPACRQTYDEFGTKRIDWAPAKECSVELHASDLSLDELFDEATEFEVVSPVAIEYRWSGYDADCLHLRPAVTDSASKGVSVDG